MVGALIRKVISLNSVDSSSAPGAEKLVNQWSEESPADRVGAHNVGSELVGFSSRRKLGRKRTDEAPLFSKAEANPLFSGRGATAASASSISEEEDLASL